MHLLARFGSSFPTFSRVGQELEQVTRRVHQEYKRVQTERVDSRVRSIYVTKSVQLQDAQLSQRDRAAGCVIFFAKSRRLELGDNILRTLYVYLQPL